MEPKELGIGKSPVNNREILIQNAVEFLIHPNVVNTPDQRKISFLKGKGLTDDEIAEAYRRMRQPVIQPPELSSSYLSIIALAVSVIAGVSAIGLGTIFIVKRFIIPWFSQKSKKSVKQKTKKHKKEKSSKRRDGFSKKRYDEEQEQQSESQEQTGDSPYSCPIEDDSNELQKSKQCELSCSPALITFPSGTSNLFLPSSLEENFSRRSLESDENLSESYDDSEEIRTL